MKKRSSPLISAGVLSSEGLCCSHLALLRQLTSALIATHGATLYKSSRLRFAYTPDLQRIALIHAADAQLTLVIVKGEAVTVSSQKMFRELHIFCCSPCWFVPSQPPKGGAMNVWAGLCF